LISRREGCSGGGIGGRSSAERSKQDSRDNSAALGIPITAIFKTSCLVITHPLSRLLPFGTGSFVRMMSLHKDAERGTLDVAGSLLLTIPLAIRRTISIFFEH